ncbi:uncharacterized protein K460DRAFT_364715 [Cucurbitaria berberidis CBS 394.84]|uniref:Uncharacterized protein n=1 Tax=Cucurbitaria berberidis CBS 394.84 TaxID=1168544 RepID=A0A9P4GLT9_9PLEO|nr:uncharacterized protein K460DRAFT_364715 [Cucurbitaria berberidis CBS 394.84]KAF1848733.1 hypothetical protein K460DRAFT_364715 [Cucurbitaria berberidis CBS 394.84]
MPPRIPVSHLTASGCVVGMDCDVLREVVLLRLVQLKRARLPHSPRSCDVMDKADGGRF